MHLSPHFTLRDLCHSNAAKKYGINNYPYENSGELNFFIIMNLSRLCSIVLEPLIDFTKTGTLRINSGYRCHVLNEKICGKPFSYHKSGLAADIPISQFKDFKLVDSYLQKLLGTILKEYIKYKTFIHVSLNTIY